VSSVIESPPVGVFQYVVSIGDLRNAGICTNLIKNGIPISRAKEKIIKKETGCADFLSV